MNVCFSRVCLILAHVVVGCVLFWAGREWERAAARGRLEALEALEGQVRNLGEQLEGARLALEVQAAARAGRSGRGTGGD